MHCLRRWMKTQGGGIFLAPCLSSPLILPPLHLPLFLFLPHTRSLAWRLCPRLLHSSLATAPSPAPLLRSHSDSLLLSLLDKPDVALIRHTNVIRLLYNHPFPCFHALSPNLRHVSRILFHSQTTSLSVSFLSYLFGGCTPLSRQSPALLFSLTRLKSMVMRLGLAWVIHH